ncbi:MAG: ATP-binding protein [Bacteroidetes bacterium]|nr:ATP-binding protein [Bacteroidota bacterium]
MQLQLTEFDVQDFIDSLAADIRNMLKEGQSLMYIHKGGRNVKLDENMLKDIILSLLSNAIKYTGARGDIRMRTEKTHGYFILTVSDTGIGIPHNDRIHIYTRGFRGSNVSHTEGNGEGLHQVKEHIDNLQGSIECDSQLNNGTTFKVTLDLSRM